MSQLIQAEQLLENTTTSNWVIIDCQSDLKDRKNSYKLYQDGHLPNAIHAHLEDDLSSIIIPGKTGRHPLPSSQQWQNTLQRWGITKDSMIVVYDQSNSMFAARAWWLLKWAGLKSVFVLDGGLKYWQSIGGETTKTIPKRTPSKIEIEAQPDLILAAKDLLEMPENSILLDARALDRYKGKTEPLDNKAGHIPGALNADFTKNLSEDNRFLSTEDLTKRFEKLKTKQIVSYCGSGVTACHNILALQEAGFTNVQLYPGSWSEWITDENRQIATGIEGGVL